MKNYNLKSISFLLICGFVIFFAGTAAFIPADTTDGENHFVVSSAKSFKLSAEKEEMLVVAFKKVYGKRIGFEKLSLEKVDGQAWIAVFGSDGTVGVQLKMDRGQWVMDLLQSAALICKKGDGCSCCKFSDCGCGKRGGTTSCGSTSCDEAAALKDDWSRIREYLQP